MIHNPIHHNPLQHQIEMTYYKNGEKVNPKELTMKGLAVLNDIRLPKKEGIALINTERDLKMLFIQVLTTRIDWLQ